MSSKSAMSTATEISSNVIKKFSNEGCDGMSHAISMTNSEIAQAAHLSYTGASPAMNHASVTDSSSSAPRLNLRKRAVTEVEEPSSVVMSSYDSAFMCGLFADIAETRTSESDSQSADNSTSSKSQDTSLNLPRFPSPHVEPPSKRSKISRNKSIARNGQSFFNLNSVVASGDIVSPVSPEIRHDNIITTSTAPANSNATTTSSDIAFPHLPATVSDQDLTRIDLHLPARQSTETYGWFVDMDSSTEEVIHETNAYAAKEDKQELAFNYPTAPVKSDMDAQVEWAQAADTIDDVLGDFF